MMLCEYGCGQEALYQLKNKKWCCSKSSNSCPMIKEKNRISNTGKIMSKEACNKLSEAKKGHIPWNTGKRWSNETRKKISEAKKGCVPWNKGKRYQFSDLGKKTVREKKCITIELIKSKYPFFSQIEDIRYNPNNENKEIQVRCKNHNCKNSKERNGWFTPTAIQLYERIRQLEKDYGNGGCYFYCSDECKNECPLYGVNPNHFIDNDKQEQKRCYTQQEYQIFREFVLERDNYICQYCGKIAEHVHHERTQKQEPFFALDPDLAWSVCSKCHYEKAHKKGTTCSTSSLAKI